MNRKKIEGLVRISDYYLDEKTRDTMISSRHHPIISGYENLTDEQILAIKEKYMAYEREYRKPINVIKRLVKCKH